MTDETPSESADRAELAADDAAISADEARLAKLEAEETANATQMTVLGNLIGSVQSQMLWITCAALLIGAAADHILTSAFS